VSAHELAELARIYDVGISWLAGEEASDWGVHEDKLKLAARELAKLKPEDVERLMQLLRTIRSDEDASK
jgi:hypothetical protein